MKKLVILKSLVDFIWIVTCIPLIPLVLFFCVYQFFDTSVIDLFVASNGGEAEYSSGLTRSFIFLTAGLIFVGVYCFFLFRKTIRFYQQNRPFDIMVIKNYNRIGQLLVIFGSAGSILTFIFRMAFENQIIISFGLTPHIFMICLGLFFMILSETFKIAKAAKEENDLTV